MNPFSQFVRSKAPATPELPLSHTCEGFFFRDIVKSQQLKTAWCKRFDEDLLYFFYGRPAYRPHGPDMPTSNSTYYPVCLLLREGVVTAPVRVAPFDTGGFFAGLYKDHIHPAMKIDNFLLRPDADVPGRLVATFYSSNREYFHPEPTVSHTTGLQFEVECYQNLITDNGKTKCDDRRSTVEVQHAAPIDIFPGAIRLVVLPRSFLAEPGLEDTIKKTWKAKCLPYNTRHCDTAEYYSEIFRAVGDYLKTEKLI